MLYVKIMSDQDMPDTDPYKHFTIVPVANNEVMRFCENEDWDKATPPFPRFVLQVHAPEGGIESHALTGNAYVMAESGKTIATHGC
jgi:hypothetical protein